MLVFTLLYALSPAALAAPDPHQAFRDWVWQAAKAEELGIAYWGPADLDRDGDADEAMAALCGKPRTSLGYDGPIRVFEADGRRWVVEGRTGPCDDTTDHRPPFEPLGPTDLGLALDLGEREHAAFLELVDGRLEFTRLTGSVTSRFDSFSLEADWVRRARYTRWTNYWTEHRTLPSGEVIEESKDGPQINHAALIVVESKPTERATLNRVLSGADAWDGPDDATLSVTAVEPAPGYVDVIIRVKDDVRTPEDHLELWWCEATAGCEEHDTLRPVTVWWAMEGHSTSDPPWLYEQPPMIVGGVYGALNAPIPPVTQAIDGTITVRFTHEQLGVADFTGWSIPFTIVYMDVDAPSGPQTRIATSDLEWSDRVEQGEFTLGTLMYFPDLHPFPTLQDLPVIPTFIHSMRALEPGEGLIRPVRAP